VFNGDLSSRLAAARDCLVARLGDAVARWGGTVPEDPGIAELADLLEETAGTFRDQTGAPKTELLAAVNHLRDADRLGGLLPGRDTAPCPPTGRRRPRERLSPTPRSPERPAH
jgi:hypothetical protein